VAKCNAKIWRELCHNRKVCNTMAYSAIKMNHPTKQSFQSWVLDILLQKKERSSMTMFLILYRRSPVSSSSTYPSNANFQPPANLHELPISQTANSPFANFWIRPLHPQVSIDNRGAGGGGGGAQLQRPAGFQLRRPQTAAGLYPPGQQQQQQFYPGRQQQQMHFYPGQQQQQQQQFYTEQQQQQQQPFGHGVTVQQQTAPDTNDYPYTVKGQYV
jgi:hypothetical protein